MQRVERILVLGAALLLVVVATFDAIEDVSQEQGWIALLADLLYVLFSLGILLFLYRLSPLSLRSRDSILTSAVITKHKDSETWRKRASELLQGLGKVIEEQFDDWKLSPAEKEIALFLLKGFSLKEIATVRETSERTVRQQASLVYTKAGVSGRAELSAFFLEDLLLPNLR
jgi:DNA-binding CsgD family transcriptional regulator